MHARISSEEKQTGEVILKCSDVWDEHTLICSEQQHAICIQRVRLEQRDI